MYLFRHYRRAVGALVIFDLTKKLSFDNVQKWVKTLKKHAEPEIMVILVGNKLDLCQNPKNREVSVEEAEMYAETNKFFYIETSAITATNIKEAFEILLECI